MNSKSGDLEINYMKKWKDNELLIVFNNKRFIIIEGKVTYQDIEEHYLDKYGNS